MWTKRLAPSVGGFYKVVINFFKNVLKVKDFTLLIIWDFLPVHLLCTKEDSCFVKTAYLVVSNNCQLISPFAWSQKASVLALVQTLLQANKDVHAWWTVKCIQLITGFVWWM